MNASKQELGGFGWWFASKKFPDEWSIRQLIAVDETFRNINPDFAVMKRLAELGPAYPYEAVRCLGIIFEEDRGGSAIHGSAESPQTIIREALKGNEQSRAEADRVVNPSSAGTSSDSGPTHSVTPQTSLDSNVSV